MKCLLQMCVAAMFVPVMILANGMTTDRGKPTIAVFDADISLAAGGTYHMTNNNNYLLKEGVFVDSGCTLIIDSGTVIKGEPGVAENSKFLCIARGGKIFANGTRNYPIIFTGSVDSVWNPVDIPFFTNSLWGGLLVLGKSTLNTTDGTGQIEGIVSTEPRGAYGGGSTPDSMDNSGVIRYVSIRHGGTEIGSANEINGLTMGAVGAGTTIEYVEVFNNYDDGYEWFGGTVNTRHLVSAFCGDDAFDYDEGFRGAHQFWFAIQDKATANRGGEHDGGTEPENGRPYAEPWIYNATFVGGGRSSANIDNDRALYFRDNAGGHYRNSIFTEFRGRAVTVEDDTIPGVEDSRARLEAGELSLKGCSFLMFGNGPTIDKKFQGTFLQTYMQDPLNSNNNADGNPFLMIPSRESTPEPHFGWVWKSPWWPPFQLFCPPICPDPPYYYFNPQLLPSSPEANSALTIESTPASFNFLVQTDYRGAFPAWSGTDELWVSEWTYMDFLGMLWRPQYSLDCGDANADGSTDVSDAVWIINYVFVGGLPPDPLSIGDANCDVSVDVSDAVWIINYVFVGGNPPCELNGDAIPDC